MSLSRKREKLTKRQTGKTRRTATRQTGIRAKLSRAKLASRRSGTRPTGPRQTRTRQKGRANLERNSSAREYENDAHACQGRSWRRPARSCFDVDLIRLGGLIGPICRSITSILDSCLVKKHAGTLLPQMLYYVRAFHLLNRCSAIYHICACTQWRINNGAIGARAPGPRAPGGPQILK